MRPVSGSGPTLAFVLCCFFVCTSGVSSAQDLVPSAVPIQFNSASFKYSSENGEAPFSLLWGMSKEQAEQSGLTLAPLEDAGAPSVYLAAGMKESLPDTAGVYLYFGADNRLWSVTVASGYFKNDPTGAQAISNYNAVRAYLGKKYGQGTLSHTDDPSGLKDPTSFVQNLLLGRTLRSCDYDDGMVHAKVALGARDFATSYYVVNFKHRELAKNNAAQER